MPDTSGVDPLEPFLGQIVILDTQGPLVYIGTLRQITEGAVVLSDADVHDRHGTS